jgi:hypothetical protein
VHLRSKVPDTPAQRSDTFFRSLKARSHESTTSSNASRVHYHFVYVNWRGPNYTLAGRIAASAALGADAQQPLRAATTSEGLCHSFNQSEGRSCDEARPNAATTWQATRPAAECCSQERQREAPGPQHSREARQRASGLARYRVLSCSCWHREGWRSLGCEAWRRRPLFVDLLSSQIRFEPVRGFSTRGCA